MLCKVICQISVTGPPVHFELFLSDSVLDPVKSHVHGLGAVLFDLLVGESCQSSVVNLDWSRRLGMTHLVKGNAQRCSLIGIFEKDTAFGFCV